MRGTFTIPPLKEGHRYRLVVGGLSHMNNGDGVRVYVNGKQVLEREREFKKREGGHPIVLLHRQGASGRVPERHGDRLPPPASSTSICGARTRATSWPSGSRR